MSSFNGLIEQPHREGHKAVRIALASNTNLPTTLWCYARNYHTYLSRRIFHSGANCVPYFKWFKRKPKFSNIHAWGTPGYKIWTDMK